MQLRVLTGRRAARVFSPRASFLCHSTSVRLWGKHSRRHIQQQAAAVSTQHFCRDRRRRSAWPLAVLLSLSVPPPSLSAQLRSILTNHRIH